MSQLDLSQQAMADRAQVSRSMLQRFLYGEPVELDTACRIIEAAGLELHARKAPEPKAAQVSA